ncbi:MAG: sugar phosphate isomerase/epimerase [Verrucomicrobiales bacterium]|nr:sugar phosphate isomerase/epimerase [Verrucomicrobiales bacterium]
MNLSNRRSFLQQIAVAAAGSAGLPRTLAADPPPPRDYAIGCYTRPWDQLELGAALDGIAEAGYRYAGIMTAKGKSWVIITPETTVEEAAKVGDEVRQRGLKTSSVYGDFKPTSAVADGVKALTRLIDNAAACGSPDLLLGGTGDPALSDAYYKAVAECCDLAAAKKVRLTIKPHGGLNATGPQCRRIIEQVGHPNFRLWYDAGNIFYYSDGALDPVADAATVDGLVAGMSVKDFLPPKEVMVTPGTGRVDFPKVFATLRAGGFTRGPLVVECTARGDGLDVTAEARKAREFLEGLLAGMARPR